MTPETAAMIQEGMWQLNLLKEIPKVIGFCDKCGGPIFANQFYVAEPNGDGRADFWCVVCANTAIGE